MTHQAHRAKVLVAGKVLDATAIRHASHDFQPELQQARLRYGSAMCMCQGASLPLVIRERGGKLFLAAWPEQAAQHAMDCPFYSERGEAGQSHASAGAIARLGDRTEVALHHGLYKVGTHSYLDAAKSKKVVAVQSHSNKLAKMHLWGLLHFLWEESGLNRWQEGWKRDWGLVRYVLRRTAQSTFVDSAPLIQSLYIPPVWTDRKRDETRGMWREFVEPLMVNHRRSSLVASGFVIGAVRSLEESEYGHVIKLHHMAERFYMDVNVSKSTATFSRRGWAALKHLEVVVDGDQKPHVVGAFRIQATSKGGLNIVEAVLMRVTPRYIPVGSSYEDTLGRLLVREERSFVRPLHYDQHMLSLPDFILKDAVLEPAVPANRGVALYVYGAAVNPIKKRQAEKLDRRAAADAHLQYWQWDAGTNAQPPPLPPRFNALPTVSSHSSKDHS